MNTHDAHTTPSDDEEHQLDLTTFSEKQTQFRNVGRLHWVHWLIISLSLIITFFAWNTSQSALLQQNQIRFEREAERVLNRTRERIDHYEDALLAGVAAIQSHEGNMSHASWREYNQFLNLNHRFQGVGGFGVIHHANAQDNSYFLHHIQPEKPGYQIYAEHSYAQPRPTTYFGSESQDQATWTLDVAYETGRQTAALIARSQGITQISGPVSLSKADEHTLGLIFYAPFYNHDSNEALEPWVPDTHEENFRGFVYATLVVNDLIESVMGNETKLVSVSIIDSGIELYAKDQDTHDSTPSFIKEELVNMHGRQWHVKIVTTPAFIEGSNSNHPIVVLISGICVDIILFGLFWIMTHSNRQMMNMTEEMTDNLSHQAVRLNENNRDLKSFAHIASHDLVTPIRNIHSLTQVLEEDLADYLANNDAKNDIQHCLDELKNQAHRSQSLINGVLQYSALESRTSEETTVDTRKLILSIGQQLKLTDKQLTLNGHFPCLTTSAIRLQQVFTNLISNAVKYNADIATATVEVSVVRRNQFVQFSVKDNGPGIPARFHQRIFEPFTTLETVTDTQSSGIGLSIVQRAVERQGGQVLVESDETDGATFHVIWPIYNSQASKFRQYARGA